MLGVYSVKNPKLPLTVGGECGSLLQCNLQEVRQPECGEGRRGSVPPVYLLNRSRRKRRVV